MGTSMESWLPRHRITVDEYHRMAEVGLLAEDARVELIEGEIIDMAPTGSRHSAVVSWLNELLGKAVGNRAIVWVQCSVQLSRSSEPQPDLALLKRRGDFYASAHPRGADTLLVVEVSDTACRKRGSSICPSLRLGR
ncbi:MAG TPA: Uma2 family endonuclease [Steroidobacteraceae bacterium]|nr:Uma2 family endonuclease [Steroidobacteraceae bacterium]